MNRVVIVGSGGAGKSRLARRLGAVTGLPVVHLDREYWRPGWTKPPSAEWRTRVDALLAGERWITDGNFESTMARRFAAADTLVFLDVAPVICVWRALRRTVFDRARADLADGCRERVDLEFLRWIWRYRREQRPKVLARLAEHAQGRTIAILRGDADIEAFLAGAARARSSG